MKNFSPVIVLMTLIMTLSVSYATDAPSTPDELLKRFDAAFKAKDKQAILDLYDWQGVSQSMKSMQEEGIDRSFLQDLKSVTLAPLPPALKAMENFVRDGILYRSNVTH